MFQRIDGDFNSQNTPAGVPQDFMQDTGFMQMPIPGTKPMGGTFTAPQSSYTDQWANYGMPYGQQYGTMPSGASTGAAPYMNMPASQSMNMPAGQSMNMPTGQSMNMPAGQSMNMPAGQSMNMPAGQPMMGATEGGSMPGMYPGMTPMQNVMFYCPYMYTMPMTHQMQQVGPQTEMQPGAPTRQGGALPFLLYGLSGLVPPPYYGYQLYPQYPPMYPYTYRPFHYYDYDDYHHHYYRD